MLAIEMRDGAIGDEELTRVGIFALVRHAENTSGVVYERAIELIGERQVFPRALATALLAINEAGQESTGRIFFDCGGPSIWAAYPRVLSDKVDP